MATLIRTYACVTLALFLWACHATGHATLNNLAVSCKLAAPLSLVALLPMGLYRLAFAARPSGGSGLNRVLFRFPTGDAFYLRHLLTSVCIWGIIGSGKSSSSGLFLARLLLKLKSGGLICASNPDDAAWWIARFEEAGRGDDLIVFHKGGEHRWNFLSELQKSGADARAITDYLVIASETLAETKGKEDAYWKALSERLLYNIISALMLAEVEVSAVSIASFLATAAYSLAQLESPEYQKGFCSQVMRQAGAKALGPLQAGDYALLHNYWMITFVFMDERPRSSAISAVENITHCLSVGYARELFSSKTTTTCEVLHAGRWILLDFPVSAEGVTAKLIYGCAKLAVQRQVLKNHWTPDQPISVIWADEAWHICNKGDRDFLAEARKHGGVLVYLTQSILNFEVAMGGDEVGIARAKSFVGMIGTLIVHASDVKTAEYMCELVGEADQKETGGSYQPPAELDKQWTVANIVNDICNACSLPFTTRYLCVGNIKGATMLRMTPIADGKRAAKYFGESDGGYYLEGSELRREWGGKGAALLGLTGTPEMEQFNRLIHGYDPHTGEQLTAKMIEERIPAWDFTASVPKGVTTALECGDERIREAIWEAGRETMADIEPFITTRVRKGGQDADRVTGNGVWMAVEHYETRPAKADGMPDWDRHIHFVQMNLTIDEAEGQWKAVKIRPVFDLRKYFDRRFDSHVAAKLAELGYQIETKYAPGDDGGMRFHTWDIKAAPGQEAAWATLNAKQSRRTGEVDALEAKIVASRKQADADAPDQLSQAARDKLGGTSRLVKRKDMTLTDYRDYWQGKITADERRAVEETIRAARLGLNPQPEHAGARAMEYALAHHFQRNSVVGFRELEITAMERSMGAARPDDFRREAERQGVLFAGEESTTRAVWDQEQRIIGFARAGRGNFTPLAADAKDGLAGLSVEQKAAVRHVWNSTDQIILIRGGAGTGKTTMMTPALAHLGAPVVLLAPSADASRTTLRKEGFGQANTVAAFLSKPEMQRQVKGGGIIWVDEAGMLSVGDLERLCDSAGELGARLVLQGDPKQHKAVDRHGNMLEVLEAYAGLPVAKLTTIQRQRGDYAGAVAAIRDGEFDKGDAALRRLGWVVEGTGHDAIVAEYGKAIEETKADGSRKSVLVIDPTHKDGDKLTERLRALRRDRGLIEGPEQQFTRLVPLGWTDAQKADAARYTGREVVQFYRNTGPFKPGQRVAARELLPHLARVKAGCFAVFEEKAVGFAVGDQVRFTGNGFDVSRKHEVDNGRIDRIKAFTPKGDIVLGNGWVVSQNFGHLKHGLVQTSPATQSKTDDIVLACMNKNSLGAMSAEQAYVTISRGRERGMIFTDLPREELLKAVAGGDKRRSATELLSKPPEADTQGATNRMRQFMEKVRATYRQIHEKTRNTVRETFRQRTPSYGR